MNPLVDHPLYLSILILAVMAAVIELGFHLGSRTAANADEEQHAQIVGARDGIGILLSLLLSFTLAMSLTRYEQRRELVIDEANAIGTTALRAHMLAEPYRSEVLGLLREYVDARLKFSEAQTIYTVQPALEQRKELQNKLWQESVKAAQQSPTPITSIFVQSLNESIDLSEKRLAARENRVPEVLWMMLISIAVLACLTIGYSSRRRSIAMLISPLTIAIVMGLTADLDTYQSGFIKVSQRSLHRLQSDLK
jgi:Na+/H+ antiporter NhaC